MLEKAKTMLYFYSVTYMFITILLNGYFYGASKKDKDDSKYLYLIRFSLTCPVLLYLLNI